MLSPPSAPTGAGSCASCGTPAKCATRADFSAEDVQHFLSHLAVEREVCTGTQGQALNALVFLYGEVLEGDLGEIGNFERGKPSKRLPKVSTRSEVRAVLGEMSGTAKLLASLLYGAGLRLSEALRLRVKDLDFEREHLMVREGKGKKDRVTMPPVLAARAAQAPAFERCGRGTKRTSKRASARSPCRRCWRANILMRTGVAVALGVRLQAAFHGPAKQEEASAPPLALFRPAPCATGGASFGHRKESQPDTAAQLCDAPVRERLRRAHGAAAPGPREPGDDDGLHPRGRKECRGT